MMRFWLVILVGLVWHTLPSALANSEGVILLHGLARSKDSMEPMAQALREAGFATVNAGYPSREASVSALSRETIRKALSDPALASCCRIHFVTHSMGGILVRDYLRRYNIPRLGRIVMLGPPNQGSEVVDYIGDWWLFGKINGPAGRELGTGIRHTPQRLGPVTAETGIIAGKRSINWINSLMIPGPDDGKVSVAHTKVAGMADHTVVACSHPFLMKDREAIALTIRFLKTGSFAETETQASDR